MNVKFSNQEKCDVAQITWAKTRAATLNFKKKLKSFSRTQKKIFSELKLKYNCFEFKTKKNKD